MDRQIVLEQGVGADDVELRVLEARQFALGLDVRPGDVVALPAEPAQGLEGRTWVTHGAQENTQFASASLSLVANGV